MIMMPVTTYEEQQAQEATQKRSRKELMWCMACYAIASATFVGIGSFYLYSGMELESETERLDPTVDFRQLQDKCTISQVVYKGSLQKRCSRDSGSYDCGCSDSYSFLFRAPELASVDGFVVRDESYEYNSRVISIGRNAKSCAKSPQIHPVTEKGDNVTCWRPQSPWTSPPPTYKCGNEECVKVVNPQYDINEVIAEAEGSKRTGSFSLTAGVLGVLFFVFLPLGCAMRLRRRLRSLDSTDNSKSVLLSIDLDRPSGVYYPEESVTGRIVLKCTSHAVLCRSLTVSFGCNAYTRIVLSTGDNATTHTGLTISHKDSLTLRGNYCRTDLVTTRGVTKISVEDLGTLKMPCTPSGVRRLNLVLRVLTPLWKKCRGECMLNINDLIQANSEKTVHLTRNGKPCSSEITLSAEMVSNGDSSTSSFDVNFDMEAQGDSYLALRFHRTKGLPKEYFFEVYEPTQVITEGKALPAPEFSTIFPPGTKIVAPFQFDLQKDAPPSTDFGNMTFFQFSEAYIRYNIAVSLDVPSDQRPSFCNRSITVLANRPLPPPALLCTHVNESTVRLARPKKNPKKRKNGSENAASIRIELERLAYAPGEVMNLERSSILCEGPSGSFYAQVVLMIHYELITGKDREIKKFSGSEEFPIGQKITVAPNRRIRFTGEFRIPPMWKDSKGNSLPILPSFDVAEGLCDCIRWAYELGIRVSVDERSTRFGETGMLSAPILISCAPPQEAWKRSDEPARRVDFMEPWELVSNLDLDQVASSDTALLQRNIGESMLVAVGPPIRQLDHRDSETTHQHMALNFGES